MTVYQFKSAARITGDAQVIGEAIATVRETTGAGFSPRAVKEAAADPGSPLHPVIYDRGVEEAADAYYEDRAAYVIRSVVVEYEDEAHEKRLTNAFVSVTERETEEARYLPVFVAMSDEDYRAQIVAAALRDLLALRHKYHEVKEFARVFSAIDAAADKLRRRKAA